MKKMILASLPSLEEQHLGTYYPRPSWKFLGSVLPSYPISLQSILSHLLALLFFAPLLGQIIPFSFNSEERPLGMKNYFYALIDEKDFYEFPSKINLGTTEIGFSWTVYSKEEIEEKILLAFPPSLRQKVHPVLRPLLHLCEKHKVDPLWALSVMWTESHFRPFIKSGKGAKGLMQVMPETKKYLLDSLKKEGIRPEAYGPDYALLAMAPFYKKTQIKKLEEKILNIELGVYYLKKLQKRFGNQKYATVAYNMGPMWTATRLRKKRPVGNKNLYWNKVETAYVSLVTKTQI